MLSILKSLVTLVILGLILSGVSAQNDTRLEFGDPPVAGLITVSAPDENGFVTISTAVGAVFPAAQVAVRNLYTGDTAYVQAGLNGSFTTTVYGPGNTPFWISPAQNISTDLRDRPGSLPGGPGTIIYGALPQTPPQTGVITQLVLDGDLADWEAYSSSALVTAKSTVQAFINQDSIYVAVAPDGIPADYSQLNIVFTLDGVVYNLALDPRLQQIATLSRLQPNPNTMGTVAAAASQGEAIEVRIPLRPFALVNPTVQSASLEELRFADGDGADVKLLTIEKPLPIIQETDGIVRLSSLLSANPTRFTISGKLAQGSQRWLARGRINQLAFKPGEQLVLEMDVVLDAPDLPLGIVGLQMLGQLRLQPIVDAGGAQTAGGLGSSNGWSDVLTPSGLAITNLRGDFPLTQSGVPANQVIRHGGQLSFPLDFAVTLPDDLPAGMYVPLFEGSGQVADGDIFRWSDSSPLGSGKDTNAPFPSRLPLVLNIGGVTTGHLLWTLFQDAPSAGSRGLLADEDRGKYALSNRVHFDNPTYILPPSKAGEPITYPIEPYLLNQLPNEYQRTAAPLIPFLFPGGRLTVHITRPDGQVDDLGNSAIVQSQLSTPALNERDRFGAQSQVDVYRLTTLNHFFTDYSFSQYGEYQISLTGSLEDIWGNHYDGGGTYPVLIAEPLTLLAGVLPGTPFEVGNTFNPGVHLSPGVPADVTITARIYPLDGSKPVEHVIKGQANASGYFQGAGQEFTFDTPGEYVIDYEVRYTDGDNRLWAGSLRSAGVIASPDGALIAHGQRGPDDDHSDSRPAWFDLSQYTPDAPAALNYPYYSGDVAWLADTVDSHMKPVIQLQDNAGSYASWLMNNFPDYVAGNGVALPNLVARQELPSIEFAAPDSPFSIPLNPDSVVSQSYSYLSADLAGLSARQFVLGGLDGGLLLDWDMDDPYNGQPGAGIGGARPGDFFFLFGGSILRNDTANIQEADAYASLAVVVDAKTDAFGTRIAPPYRGEAGGPSGGPLLVLNGREVDLFFHPTGIRPGDALRQGDTVALAGQFGPTLPSTLAVTIISPSGKTREFEGTANAIGYFYDPTQDFAVNEVGVWTVQIHASHLGNTSAGQVEPPPPTGDILGTADGHFNFYVMPKDAQALDWNETRSDLPIAPAVPYNFNFPLPSDWTDIQVYHTVTIPGFVLAQGPLHANGRSFSYQYNPANPTRIFPNLEISGLGEGASSSDLVTITFIASGIDSSGSFQIRSRTFTIAHDRMITFG